MIPRGHAARNATFDGARAGGAHREWPHVALLQALAQPLDLRVHRSLVVLVDAGGLRWEAEERG